MYLVCGSTTMSLFQFNIGKRYLIVMKHNNFNKNFIMYNFEVTFNYATYIFINLKPNNSPL